MVKKYDNEFKVNIVALLNSGINTKQVREDYDLSLYMIGSWRREYKLKFGYFSKKKDFFNKAKELNVLNKELKNGKMEQDILKKEVSCLAWRQVLRERLIRYQFILKNVDLYPIEKMCKSMIVI